MSSSSFKFTLLDVSYYTKDNVKRSIITCYCSYGFIVRLFSTEDKGKKIIELSKNPNFDMTQYISVSYNSKEDKFIYLLNI